MHSRVGWHCDDEPLFGEVGTSKLIVSVSFGSLVSFFWKGKSCPDGDASSCYLGHGDILVMDGQCQDEFLHCTDPGLEHERINVTFRWIRQHTPSCPLRAGVVCCLPTCAQGFSVPVVGNGGFSSFWVWWELLGALCVWRMLVLLVFSLILTGFEFQRYVFRWTRFLGGGRWRHFFRNSRGVSWSTPKSAVVFHWGSGDFGNFMLYMLALVGQPSLRGRNACMVFRARGASWRNCRQNFRKTSFSPLFVFLLSRISGFLWEVVLWHLWIGRAGHPGPGSVPFLIEVLNVGGWLTHCDFALDVGVDFLAVVEHRLIPASVRSEWARLRCRRLPPFGRLLRRRRLMLVILVLVLLVCVVLLFRCLLLLLLVFSVFLTVVGLSGVCFLWVVVGLCIWLFYMVIRGLIVILSSLP